MNDQLTSEGLHDLSDVEQLNHASNNDMDLSRKDVESVGCEALENEDSDDDDSSEDEALSIAVCGSLELEE